MNQEQAVAAKARCEAAIKAGSTCPCGDCRRARREFAMHALSNLPAALTDREALIAIALEFAVHVDDVYLPEWTKKSCQRAVALLRKMEVEW